MTPVSSQERTTGGKRCSKLLYCGGSRQSWKKQKAKVYGECTGERNAKPGRVPLSRSPLCILLSWGLVSRDFYSTLYPIPRFVRSYCLSFPTVLSLCPLQLASVLVHILHVFIVSSAIYRRPLILLPYMIPTHAYSARGSGFRMSSSNEWNCLVHTRSTSITPCFIPRNQLVKPVMLGGCHREGVHILTTLTVGTAAT